MLKKFLYKKDENGNKVRMDDKDILIVFLLVLFVALIAIYTGFLSGEKTNKKFYDKQINSINNKFEDIGDNYTLVVTKKTKDSENTLKILCDKYACIYQSDLFKYKELLNINDKWYAIEEIEGVVEDNKEDFKLINTDNKELIDNFNSMYYDTKMINAIVEAVDKEVIKDNKIDTSISLERYLKEYNYIYELINKTEEEIDMKVSLTLVRNYLNKITMECKDLEKYFNKNDIETLEYSVSISSLNTNDFEPIKLYLEQK